MHTIKRNIQNIHPKKGKGQKDKRTKGQKDIFN